MEGKSAVFSQCSQWSEHFLFRFVYKQLPDVVLLETRDVQPHRYLLSCGWIFMRILEMTNLWTAQQSASRILLATRIF